MQTIRLHGSRCWGTTEFVVKEMFNMSKMFTCDVVIDTNHLSHITNTVEIQVCIYYHGNTLVYITTNFTALHHVIQCNGASCDPV